MNLSDYDFEEYEEEIDESDFRSNSVEKIFEGLNPRQVEAVECLQGPLLVIAGAGSGKTRVLTCRIANLLNHGVSPWNILAITFTNKAANEMKTRAENMIGQRAKSVWLSTFHSFCAKILRIEAAALKNYDKNFAIFSSGDSKMLIRECIRELELDDKKFDPALVQSKISAAKNRLFNANKFKEAVSFASQKSEIDIQIAKVYKLYEKRLIEQNAMDFDDLLMVAVNLFATNKEVLEKYQEKFKYILVDEYQDTNVAQYKLMKMLAAKYQNVCVVGDADQSIYGWRGADMRNIMSFEQDYPNATVIKLEQNYRSTKMILDAANAVIQNNLYRKPKNLWTENDDGEKITVYETMTGFYEAEKIADEIQNLSSEGFTYNDIALLYRINAQSRLLEEAFLKAGIPYVIIGGLKFYDRLEIKNILAYLRLISNPKDNMSLKRIINVPRRGIGLSTVAKLQEFADSHEVSIFEVISNDWLLNQIKIFPKAKASLREFTKFILYCMNIKNDQPVDEFITKILEDSGYFNELKTEMRPEDEARLENLGEFINVAKEYVNQSGDDSSLEGFLNHVSLISDLDVINNGEDRVSLMTVHSAKGLEFPIVFITGMEEGLFPHVRSLSDERQLEEERRACYVAITRAQKKLYITFAASRSSYGGDSKSAFKSRFLDEIPIDYLDIYKQSNVPSRAKPVFVHLKVNKNKNLDSITKIDPKKKAKANVLSIQAAIRSKKKSNDDSRTKNLLREWKIGDKVNHKKFGDGIVIKVSGYGEDTELKIKFLDDGVGIKTLLVKLAPINYVKG